MAPRYSRVETALRGARWSRMAHDGSSLYPLQNQSNVKTSTKKCLHSVNSRSTELGMSRRFHRIDDQCAPWEAKEKQDKTVNRFPTGPRGIRWRLKLNQKKLARNKEEKLRRKNSGAGAPENKIE